MLQAIARKTGAYLRAETRATLRTYDEAAMSSPIVALYPVPVDF